MRQLVKSALVSITAILVLLAVGVVLLLCEHYRGFEADTYIRIEKGAGTRSIARQLEESGVIRYTWPFWLEKTFRPGAKLQAGEYRFTEAVTVSQVFDKIARGEVYYVAFTVPEGSNMFEIAQALESAGVFPAGDFLHAAADPSPIRDFAPGARNLEGYLFPATYRLSHWVTPEELCRQMTDQFRRQWQKIANGKNADMERVVTLASLVEKETGVASERPLVAGVFVNRLKIGMHLDCDPTTIYAALLENRFREVIHRSDLASQNLYNTYQHSGLPPGPITNPGLAAISAALAPSDTKYLYFVARAAGGGHQFSTNLAEHEKATREYRHGAAKKNRKAG